MTPRIIDDPQPGFFQRRLVPRGPQVPCQIVHDADGWTVVVNGEQDTLRTERGADHPGVMHVWQGGREITEADYLFMLATRNWALLHQPNHPLCHPREAVHFAALPPVIPRRTP